MERCDVLVVGGGPAGAACAGRLREAGLDVLVLDRSLFPRDKPCAGWLTPGGFAALGLEAAEYASGRTLQPVEAIQVGRIGRGGTVVEYGRAVSYGILRRELDDFLLRRSGARRKCGVPVTSLQRAGDGWLVNGSIRAAVVVGAGGSDCPVARRLNGAISTQRPVVAQVLEFRMDAGQRAACRVLPERPELYFCRDLRGYGWCFRKADHMNLGLGRRDPRGLAVHVQDFVAFLRRAGRIAFDLPRGWRGHAYLVRQAPERAVLDDALLLVGDAAGLAVPESGEGLRPALHSGLLAAEALLAARGGWCREALAPYQAALARQLGEPRRLRDLPSGLLAPLGALLLGNAFLARRVVLDRWFLGAGLMRYAAARPPEQGAALRSAS